MCCLKKIQQSRRMLFQQTSQKCFIKSPQSFCLKFLEYTLRKIFKNFPKLLLDSMKAILTTLNNVSSQQAKQFSAKVQFDFTESNNYFQKIFVFPPSASSGYVDCCFGDREENKLPKIRKNTPIFQNKSMNNFLPQNDIRLKKKRMDKFFPNLLHYSLNAI